MSGRSKYLAGALFLGLVNCGGESGVGGLEQIGVTTDALESAANPSGVGSTATTSGTIDRTNPFFATLGVNLRTCETCHSSAQGWTISAKATAALFDSSQGLAPIFMIHDAGTRPDADISTLNARKKTFKDTLNKKGLIRFARTIATTAEFVASAVSDPYGWSTTTTFSSFRRPTPTTNEALVSSTTWTGGPSDVGAAIVATASGAARFHEQRVDAVPADQTALMRDFQLGLFFAQESDSVAGALNSGGAKGGATNLMTQPFFVGINDIQSDTFTSKVFDIYDGWSSVDDGPGCTAAAAARKSIYRGQEIFNNKKFNITGVHGLNDLLGQTTVSGTCTTCHNTPNVGGHSVFRMFDVGTADKANCASELPLITLQNKTTLATRQVCDMGRATNTGFWADIGGFRAPPLRGLAARAPYFHDGQAKDVKSVIDYFDTRFSIGLKSKEKKDLEAFLSAL